MKVLTARQLVTSLMTLRDYDAIVITSQSSKSSHLETRNLINYPCGSFKHALYRRTLC